MQNVTLKHPIRQMFLALVGFLVAIVLIESDGLRNWADRLEPGPLRTVALPVTASIDRVVHPLGIGAIRNRVLDETAHLGWTDDPVRLAAVSKPAPARAPESQAAACVTPVAPGPKPGLAVASI